jgi:GNAT superfamily N-acetyltransferase
MSQYRIDVNESPDPNLREEILRPLRAFNESRIGKISAEALAICLRSPEDAIIGGLWGQSVAGWLFVDLLVVPETLRGRGIGSSLLEKAEGIAAKRGCIGVWLHTGTFQAPGFYEKLGYHAFGTIPDFPPGHDCIFYHKQLLA